MPRQIENDKPYPLDLEYTWDRQAVRRTTNLFIKVTDWNQNGDNGRGEIRASYGPEYKRLNKMLQSRVEHLDSLIAEFIELNPFQLTVEVITSIMDDKPVIRRDKGRDFVEFTIERLASDYARNRIGHSRYENGKSGMNIFREFLRSTKRGTYRQDSIYVGEITPDLLESYIEWRRDVKQNSDPTINHALTPILKACAYAKDLDYIDADINARIQDMRIVTKVSLSDEEAEFDGKSLTTEQMKELLKYY